MLCEIPKPVAANIDRFTGRTWLLPPLLDWLAARRPAHLPADRRPRHGQKHDHGLVGRPRPRAG